MGPLNDLKDGRPDDPLRPLGNSPRNEVADDALGALDDPKEDRPDDSLRPPGTSFRIEAADNALGALDDRKEGRPDEPLRPPGKRSRIEVADVTFLGLLEDTKEGRLDEPLELPRESSSIDVAAVAFEKLVDLKWGGNVGGVLGGPVLPLAMLLLWHFWPVAQEVQQSPSRLFNTGRYPFLFVRHCMYFPSNDFCLASETYFITTSDSLFCSRLPASHLSTSCCF